MQKGKNLSEPKSSARNPPTPRPTTTEGATRNNPEVRRPSSKNRMSTATSMRLRMPTAAGLRVLRGWRTARLRSTPQPAGGVRWKRRA
eukprot:COSAG01_NODE_28028_length_671_cov_0.722028_1_plen_87_part_10